MRGLLKTISAIIFCIFLCVLAYHFSSPEKGLVSGPILKLRIAAAEFLEVLREDVSKAYPRLVSAPEDDRFKIGIAECSKLRDDIVTAYKRGTFTTYLTRLRTTLTELLNSVRSDMNSLDSKEMLKQVPPNAVTPHEFLRSAQTWMVMIEKKLTAVQSVSGDQAEEQIKSELVKLQTEVTAALGDFEKKLTEIGWKDDKQHVRRPESKEPQTHEQDQVQPTETAKESKDITAAPASIVSNFVARYANRDARRTPYYLKDIKILRSAQASLASVYCITFQAEVYHKHNNKRWDKSPVVLNVIGVMMADGVMATYENFSKNPGEFPRDGACVKSVWGVHDYNWEEICPYGCMSSADVSVKSR